MMTSRCKRVVKVVLSGKTQWCVFANENAPPIYTEIGPYKHSGTKFCLDERKFCMANM